MENDNCIYLNDIFNLTDEEIDNCKISLSISEGKNGQLCIDSWLRDETNLSSGFWPYYGTQTNFKVGQYCLCFYRMYLLVVVRLRKYQKKRIIFPLNIPQ